MKKKFISLVLVLITLIGCMPYVCEAESNPSKWAVSEVNEAIDNDLITNNVKRNYQADITRENFCELVIKLYEKTSSKTAEKGFAHFEDTSNPEILKAHNLGIVEGVSDTEFDPDNSITRQEICAMLTRAIGAIYKNIDVTDYEYHTFADMNKISSWAMDSVQFAYDNDIMAGIGDNKIDPLGNATCEQSILLINRIYENRSHFKRMNGSDEEIMPIKTLDIDDGEVNGVSVSFSDNRNAENVRIKEIKSSDLIYTTTGIKGTAVNISSSEDFDAATATLSFDYNPNGLGESKSSDLAIGWYNTDLDRIEILPNCKIDNSTHTVSVETTHFSEYILVDSKEWYSVWQKGQTIVRETDNNGRFAENFNVQLVVDCSGSMDGDRISKARECTYSFIKKLSDNDRFSVVKFGSNAETVIATTNISEANMNDVKDTVMALGDGGGTNFDAALTECINTLDTSDDYNNIIVFLSDGESNVSDSLLETLNNNSVRIAAVALGSGSNTSMMQKLSDKTNGQYVYAESSSDLDDIYNAIQGSLIGVDATDTDGDGLPDIVETTGMKNQYGNVIRTDPNKYDTDGDGKSDGEEMGKLIETDRLTEMDKKNGITSNVYFQMISDPVEGHKVADKVNATSELQLSATADTMDSDGNFTLHMNLNVSKDVNEFYLKFDTDDCLDWDVERIEFWHTDFDGSIYKESLLKGNYSVDIDMNCINTAQDLGCGNAHKITIYALAENADKISASVVLNKNTSSSDTPSGTTNNKSLSSEKLNEYKVDMAKASKKIADQLYNNSNNRAESNDDINEKREKIKNQMSIESLNGKKISSVPNVVYDAFALAILNALSDSDIDKYETNQNKLAKQIYKQIKGGLVSDSITIDYNECIYDVQYNVYAISGLGIGYQYIKWTDRSGTRESAVLIWNNVGTEEGYKALSEYCAALAQLNTDLWKDFLAYFISDGFGLANIKAVSKTNVDKVLDATEKVIKALCDKDEANNLLNEMGATIQDELKSGNMPWSDNKFEEFVRDNVPNGDKIIEAAQQYETVKEKYDELTNMYNQAGSLDAIEQFEAEYKLLEMIVNQL